MIADDFAFLSDLVESCSGLVLTNDKAYLIESRLLPLARKRNMKGLDELVRALRARRDEGLAREVTEAMTTNDSVFSRYQAVRSVP
jgi:chemotaxis protein methyltransferase CheR